MATQQDVIKKFMKSLDTTTEKGEAAIDEAISASSSFTSYKSLLNQIVSDCNTVNDADKFLKTYCGINLDNDDTGAISGSDAGGDLIKTAESIFPEEGELINFTGNEFTANGLTVKLGKTKSSTTVARNFSDLSSQETYLWQSIYTWWMKGSLDLIAESYGKNYGFNSQSSATTKTMWVIFNNTGKGILAATAGGPAYAQKSTDDLDLYINMYYYKNATGEDGKPDNGQAYLDRTLAHELTHAVMWANIDYFDYLPAFIKEGMAELTHGIDDVRTESIEKLAGNSTKLNQSLGLSKKTVNVSGVKSASYAGGYIFLRYLAHQNADYKIANDTAKTSIKTFYGNDTITNSASNVTIDAGAGNDSIIGGGKNNFYIWSGGNDTIKNFGATDTISVTSEKFYRETEGNDIFFRSDDGYVLLTGAANLSAINVKGNEITAAERERLTITNSNNSIVTAESLYKVIDASARTKAVNITGNANDNSIISGTGNDTLNGGKGNDTLTGGKGNDVFIYSAGKDVITDYGLGTDKISVRTAIENFGADGSDFIFDFRSGDRLTLTDGASKKISVVSGGTTKIYGDGGIFNTAQTAITLSSSTKNFTADSKIVSIDASKTNGATITGNTKANRITFGDGANVFTWSKGGNDTLEHFGADDLLSVTGGAVSDGSVKGGNTFLKIGSNTITIRDSAQISLMDDGNEKFFDSGIFYSSDKTSATLGSAAIDFNAASTNVTSVTGNAKANKFYTGTAGVTLTGGTGNDTFFCGGNDFITDYGTGADKISLGSAITNVSVNGKDLTLGFDNGNVTLAGGAGKKISIVSGGKTEVNLFTNDGIFNPDKTAVTLAASMKDFTADSKLVTIDASLTDGATITGNAKANKVTFSDGADVFLWNKGGNDTLEHFGEDDLISVKGSFSDGSIRGGNSFLRVGSNKITVKDTAQVALIDDDGEKFFDGGVLYGAGKTSATLGSAVSNFDATGKDITEVTGNDKANKLYANSTDTTLTGGKGDDSLWGSDGVDTFVYMANTGTDKIFNYESGELLQIIKANGAAGSFKNSTFANNNLTLAIDGGGKVVFQNVTSSTEFNINGTAYQIESARLSKT